MKNNEKKMGRDITVCYINDDEDDETEREIDISRLQDLWYSLGRPLHYSYTFRNHQDFVDQIQEWCTQLADEDYRNSWIEITGAMCLLTFIVNDYAGSFSGDFRPFQIIIDS